MNLLATCPQEAARRLAKKVLQQGFKPEALHEYQTQEGKVLYHRIRLKHPVTNEKWIRPLKFIDGKGYAIGEPNFPNGKPLYNLYTLTQQSSVAVWVCEGEWCVDTLTKLGILSTTSGSADSVSSADWQPLAGRKIIIWPDNDEAGLRYAAAVAEVLESLDCELWQVNIDELNLPAKGDVVDWIKANPHATHKEVTALPLILKSLVIAKTERKEQQEHDNTESNKNTKHSQASAIVNFVIERVELFHDKNSDVYALDLSTNETRRLDGRQFKDWLISSFYDGTGKTPREQSVREAMGTLSGLARFKGECHEISIRVAKHGGEYYVDLAEFGESRAICIKAGEWQIVNNPPVRFLRPETMRPLPEPISGGDISQLWQIVNIPENEKLLVITWLIDCLRPETPFPVLELIGEQGSAKSTTQMILRRLIDPNACDLRAAPKSVEDIFVTGGVNWLVSYENISHLSPPIQDALCVLATGGGFAKRKLYSDADESVIMVKRPIVLNGISAAITAQDLIDRTISIETPIVVNRAESTDIWRNYEDNHSLFLGALLDIFAMALERLPLVQLPSANCPRLIEYTRLGIAISEILGRTGEDFLSIFNSSRQESIARTIDASPVATALIEWFEKRDRQTTSLPIKTLFAQVESSRIGGSDNWPRSPKGFADALRRAAPALRQMGIECRSLGKIGGYVSWEIKYRE
ncbi:TPA: hypothetical protein F8S49_11380 [Legionella pneumophila]|nr:hypothetical protein [Legionella pneumophila]HAU1496590.1 hypothetical protein [Legionella pneumophila]